MGLPDVRWPDGREMAPQLDLREKLDLYCGLRPVRVYHPDDSPLKGLRAGDIAQMVDFFSFGTNDLTQTTFGISRDDAPTFLAAYQRGAVSFRDASTL